MPTEQGFAAAESETVSAFRRAGLRWNGFLMEDRRYDRFFDPMRPSFAVFGEYEELTLRR